MKKAFLIFIAAVMLILAIDTAQVLREFQQTFDDTQFNFLYFTEAAALFLFALSGIELYKNH